MGAFRYISNPPLRASVTRFFDILSACDTSASMRVAFNKGASLHRSQIICQNNHQPKSEGTEARAPVLRPRSQFCHPWQLRHFRPPAGRTAHEVPPQAAQGKFPDTGRLLARRGPFLVIQSRATGT